MQDDGSTVDQRLRRRASCCLLMKRAPCRALAQFQFNLTPYEYAPPADVKTEVYPPETAHGPYIQIIEEPKQRGFRFRYECEGPSHGGLPGASSEKNRRTYPTVKINNYVGHARVEVQLVTHTDPPRVHAHSLVGRHCNENGTCTLDVGPDDLTASARCSFSNLGILHVTKKGVTEVLTRRLRDEWRRRRGGSARPTAAEESALAKDAKELSKMVDLNIVRLRFTAFLEDSNGGFTRALRAVVSDAIYDSKSPNASNLKISRMDKTCGSVLGGDEIFLLCDKVQKDDIDVRFYEDEDGGWEAFGDFAPTDVHKQYAIVFKTPPYRSAEIERPVTVFLQLKRKKAGDCSDPKHFTYIPHIQDKEEVLRKKQKPLPHYEPWRGGGANGGGFGGGGAPADGFHFNQQMNGAAGGGGGGGVFYPGSGGGFGLHMSGSALQRELVAVIAGARQPRGDARVLLELHRRLRASRNASGDTPLHLSVIHRQTTVTRRLIDALLSDRREDLLDAANRRQQTALHLAALTRQASAVEALMRAGADPGLRDEDGRCPLHLAALGGDAATLRAALAHLGEGHARVLNTADYHGLAPLHLAVRRDGHRCLRLLVESGAKVNARELKAGHTALHMAVRRNLLKVACTLVTELKADVNARTFGGNTPLHLAAAAHAHTLCSVLLAAGADKYLENDEPLVLSSSSSSDDDEEREEKEAGTTSRSQPVSSRKRRVGGHTPLDLAKCHKVAARPPSTRSKLRPPSWKQSRLCVMRQVRKLLASPTARDEIQGKRGACQALSHRYVDASRASGMMPVSTEGGRGWRRCCYWAASRHVSRVLPVRVHDAFGLFAADGDPRWRADEDTLRRLVEVVREAGVPWDKMAAKLGMTTLASLYRDSPAPYYSLLQHYQLCGGPAEDVLEALASLGVDDGVRLLRRRRPDDALAPQDKLGQGERHVRKRTRYVTAVGEATECAWSLAYLESDGWPRSGRRRGTLKSVSEKHPPKKAQKMTKGRRCTERKPKMFVGISS
ncbi:nuclear factor NF-kappa-B p100 subunit isoform X3 [Syngnathoides biaculeatus]|uniref:nuclear factor NF-kappa-B p100 subunit isoform X3 n=1 Tax=Syngnathoides biaculeatus TaxID=300417 RepID=UPI002ADE2DB2|nr:nuclear factor NF-kappa-B p100 subunit isoform X3 [Syngnathoides biaculeatus]